MAATLIPITCQRSRWLVKCIFIDDEVEEDNEEDVDDVKDE